jgi:hypothetical protein
MEASLTALQGLSEELRQAIQRAAAALKAAGAREVYLFGWAAPEVPHGWAVGAVLQSFYSGIENIFKRVALELDSGLPSGGSWHSDLLEGMGRATALRPAIISERLLNRLRGYLEFRHVFRSAYVFLLPWDRMAPLVAECEATFGRSRGNWRRLCGCCRRVETGNYLRPVFGAITRG